MNTRLTQPLTKPISTYDLLTRIKEIFLEEPLRCRMNGYLWEREKGPHLAVTEWPRCGTVGCIAGWAGVLLNRGNRADFRDLGLKYRDHTELFYPSVKGSGFDYQTEEDQQTPAYARMVATHIERFQARHESVLRAHICRPTVMTP